MLNGIIHKKGKNMKITQALLLQQFLSTMLNQKGIVGYKIARNLRMINEELIEYNKQREELFKKYGTQEGDSLKIDKDSENYLLFMKEMKPFDDLEVEFNFLKITQDELMNSELTAEQMLILSDYIVEE